VLPCAILGSSAAVATARRLTPPKQLSRSALLGFVSPSTTSTHKGEVLDRVDNYL
jgi:hypothetical protein